MHGKFWYADDAKIHWLAAAHLLAAWNSGERPAALRCHAVVSPRAARRAHTLDNVKKSVNVL